MPKLEQRPNTPGFWWEIVPLTFGRARIIYTDGTGNLHGY
jgi:hypothetical protein